MRAVGSIPAVGSARKRNNSATQCIEVGSVFWYTVSVAQLMARRRFDLTTCMDEAQLTSIRESLSAGKVLHDLLIKMISSEAKRRPQAVAILQGPW